MSVIITARRATAEDAQAIWAIMGEEQVYGGLDYLPAMLRHFLNDHHYIVCVAEADGKIIALRIIMIQPGGREAIGMTARSNPKYQNIGAIATLKKFSLEELNRVAPDIQKCTMNAFYNKYWQTNLQRMIDTRGYVIKTKWRVLAFQCERRHLEELVKEKRDLPEAVSQLVRVTYKDAIKMAASDSAFLDVIKMDGDFFQVMNNWQILPVDEIGLKFAVSHTDTYVTRDPHDNQKIKAVSFGSQLPAPCGIRIDVYFYGRDTHACLDHVIAQFEQVLKANKSQRFGVMVHFPLALDFGLIESTLTAYLGQKWTFYKGEHPTEAFTAIFPLKQSI